MRLKDLLVEASSQDFSDFIKTLKKGDFDGNGEKLATFMEKHDLVFADLQPIEKKLRGLIPNETLDMLPMAHL